MKRNDLVYTAYISWPNDNAGRMEDVKKTILKAFNGGVAGATVVPHFGLWHGEWEDGLAVIVGAPPGDEQIVCDAFNRLGNLLGQEAIYVTVTGFGGEMRVLEEEAA